MITGAMMTTISWDDFAKIDMRAGTIVEVLPFPEARRPAYKLIIDFGEDIGIRKSSAQITDLYSMEELIGRQILGVVNFPPKQIGPFMSECLVTGFYNQENHVVLLHPERPVQNGARFG